MPPRSSWKGFLKLSLVSVPVKAYTASSTGAEIRLNQLDKNSMTRIKYQKVNAEGKVVPANEIVSGYEYAKGQYVVIESDELDKLRTESDKSVHIDGFVEESALDPIYFSGRTYYLVPDGAVGQKPYRLLHESLKEKGLCGIAQVVIAGREQLVLLRVLDNLLAMSVLQHDAKVKPVDAFKDEVTDVAFTKEELALTHTLVDATKIEDFDYASYKDRYVEKLTQLIQLKVDGQEIVQVQDAEEPQIINFMEALKKSVAEAQGSVAAAASSGKKGAAKKKSAKSASKKGAKKQAPSAKKKASKKAKKKSG